MKKLSTPLLTPLLLAVLAFGCGGGDPVVDDSPKTLFTFTSDLDGINEMWIVLRNSETGDLIDSKQVVKNVPLVFESEKKVSNDKLSVTQVFKRTADGPTAAGVYNGVDVGSVWVDKHVFGSTHVNRGAPSENYSLRVSNVPDVLGYTLSDGVDDFAALLEQSGDVLSENNMPLYSDSRDHILSIYPKSGKPRYQFFNGIENKAIKETSYTNMKEYEKIVNVKFPQGKAPFGTIESINNGKTYMLYNNLSFDDQPDDLTEINLGFLSASNNYDIILDFDDFGFQYMSSGPAPSVIQYVSPERFVINNRSLDKFSATASNEYSFRAVHYVYDDADDKSDVDITYYDPSPGARHNDPFTSELITKFSIPMNKVTFESATFSVAGQTYDQWKAFYFDESFTETTYASAAVTVK